MKNKITTPDGIRIALDNLSAYLSDNLKVSLFSIGDDDMSCTNIHFNTTEERDAFLARLDAYFQEIP
jgi:hypothetical protein